MGEPLDLKTLDTLVNAPTMVTVGGVEREITPIRVAELPAMLRACEPIFGALAGGDLMAALMRDADSAIAAIAICARMSRAEIDALQTDEMVVLGSAVLRVNADFFVRRLAPALIGASETLTAVLAGSTPSPASSARGLGDPTT